MHLGNGIICPVTGIPMIAVAGITAVLAYKKARQNFRKENILPAVLITVFVFALQMINFSIPGTGSSGHIIGAILLAALLGPYVAFLSICSILTVQSVFFADGGLMALGCNIFNMGILACFVAYPLCFKPLIDKKKPVLAAILSSVFALQIGSIAVVIESVLSGSMTNNILQFSSLMQSIHFVIGLLEGVFTALVVGVAYKFTNENKIISKSISYAFGGASLALAGIIAQFASQKPDGLEWSLLKMSDSFVLQSQSSLYSFIEALQVKLAVLSQIPAIPANILGVLATGSLMIILAYALSHKESGVYEQ